MLGVLVTYGLACGCSTMRRLLLDWERLSRWSCSLPSIRSVFTYHNARHNCISKIFVCKVWLNKSKCIMLCFSPATLLTRSITVPPAPNQGILVRAVYNHSAEGESQLNFVEGDVISLLGDKSDGWHYGHNSRTSKFVHLPAIFSQT